MIYEFRIDGEIFHMEFEEHEEAPKAVERDLYGYTYMLNDRTYQDVSAFKRRRSGRGIYTLQFMRTITAKEYFTATHRSLHLIWETGSGTVPLTNISCTMGKTSTWSRAGRDTGSRS